MHGRYKVSKLNYIKLCLISLATKNIKMRLNFINYSLQNLVNASMPITNK